MICYIRYLPIHLYPSTYDSPLDPNDHLAHVLARPQVIKRRLCILKGEHALVDQRLQADLVLLEEPVELVVVIPRADRDAPYSR